MTAKFLTDVKYLWLEQIFEVRSYWIWYAAFSLLLPLIMVFGFSRFGFNMDDPLVLLRMISGAAIFTIANDGISTTAIRISTIRREGMMIYYASLPIRKSALLLALILSRSVLLLPGVVALLLVAPPLYNVPVALSPALLLLIPLLVLLFSTLGVTFGMLAATVEIAQQGTYLLLFVLVLAAPVFIPFEALPTPLQAFALLLPFTYAADALRITMEGGLTPQFWLDVGVLVAMLIAALFILERRFQWRLE